MPKSLTARKQPSITIGFEFFTLSDAHGPDMFLPMNELIDTSGDDHAVASWVWRNLVPKSGQAGTVQGELLRAVEKLRREAQQNGNINWDEGFLILVDFLEDILTAEPIFRESERQAIRADLHRLRSFVRVDELEDESDAGNLPYVEDDLYDRLTHCVVAYVREHPSSAKREPNPMLLR